MLEFEFDVTGLPVVEFVKGDIVMEEGKTGKCVYVLKEGAVSVATAGREICKINEPLTIFGEISILLETEHTATVTAEEDCVFHAIDDFVEFIKGQPESGLHVAKILCSRIANMNHTFIEIKNEIEELQADDNAGSVKGKLYDILVKMDTFWGRDVWSSAPHEAEAAGE